MTTMKAAVVTQFGTEADVTEVERLSLIHI